MKTSMIDSKRSAQRKTSGSGYGASYADKYKMKGVKTISNNNSEH